MHVYGKWTEEGKRWLPEYVAAVLNGEMPSVHIAGMVDPRGLNGGTVERVASKYLVALRGLVNNWIDSGRKEDVDSPLERIIPQEVLLDYARENPPYALIDSDGRIGFAMEPLALKPTDPEFAAIQRATWDFVQLLDSPVRERLSRCDECGIYFALARMPKVNRPNRNGTFCKEHKGKGRARSTNTARKNREQQMVRLAAELWLEYEQRHRRDGQSEWVARKMNERRANLRRTNPNAYPSIEKNWVTWHQEEIGEEVKRRKYGTRKDQRSGWNLSAEG